MQKHTKRHVKDNFKYAFISDVCHHCVISDKTEMAKEKAYLRLDLLCFEFLAGYYILPTRISLSSNRNGNLRRDRRIQRIRGDVNPLYLAVGAVFL